jgi:hypothetical protein
MPRRVPGERKGSEITCASGIPAARPDKVLVRARNIAITPGISGLVVGSSIELALKSSIYAGRDESQLQPLVRKGLRTDAGFAVGISAGPKGTLMLWMEARRIRCDTRTGGTLERECSHVCHRTSHRK